jgi:hypothetical protein
MVIGLAGLSIMIRVVGLISAKFDFGLGGSH